MLCLHDFAMAQTCTCPHSNNMYPQRRRSRINQEIILMWYNDKANRFNGKPISCDSPIFSPGTCKSSVMMMYSKSKAWRIKILTEQELQFWIQSKFRIRQPAHQTPYQPFTEIESWANLLQFTPHTHTTTAFICSGVPRFVLLRKRRVAVWRAVFWLGHGQCLTLFRFCG